LTKITASVPAASSADARRGMIIILSSPSGAGKSTLSAMLRADKALNLGVSVSVTTRTPRPSERDGVDYYFVDKAEFERRIAAGAFVEWAQVHGAYYGSLQQTVETVLERGQDIIFDIDYQGATQIQQKLPKETVSVFILPPSMAELRQRLLKRAENSLEDMQLRLRNAAAEMRHWHNYDYVLVNADLEKSFAALAAIITAERLKRRRQLQLPQFIDNLCRAAEAE